jgi:molecular chaperone HtpG
MRTNTLGWSARVIRKNREEVEMFNEVAENKDEYNKFYEASGKNLKLGMRQPELRAKSSPRAPAVPLTKFGDEVCSLK